MWSSSEHEPPARRSAHRAFPARLQVLRLAEHLHAALDVVPGQATLPCLIVSDGG